MDYFFIVSTLDHAATFHRGQGAELQLVELAGLFEGSHLLNAPLQWTARVLTPLPQVTEHYKGKTNIFLKESLANCRILMFKWRTLFTRISQ